MNTPAKLERRHDRIREVWKLTTSENTARRCECRMSKIRSQISAAIMDDVKSHLPLPANAKVSHG